MLRFDRNSIYTDRRNKAALCYDYPADEVLINGLECMQAYLSARGNSIQIPIVRVMNTAHYISTYMHLIGCDDQTEFDVLINLDIRDRQLVPIVLITLAAMLKRTEGMRARVCRSVIMENRSEDFYEGVSLYEQWLEGRTEHYTDEDFHIDLMDEINMLKEEKRQWEREREEMIKQNIELITTIDKMEKEIQNNQFNNCVIYNAPVYNSTSTTNNYYAKATQTEDVEPIAEPTENPIDSIIFTPKARREHKEALIIQSLTKAIAGRKDKTRAFVQELKSWQESEYVDAHFNAQVMFDELSKILPIPFGYEVFKKHYNNTRA